MVYAGTKGTLFPRNATSANPAALVIPQEKGDILRSDLATLNCPLPKKFNMRFSAVVDGAVELAWPRISYPAAKVASRICSLVDGV